MRGTTLLDGLQEKAAIILQAMLRPDRKSEELLEKLRETYDEDEVPMQYQGALLHSDVNDFQTIDHKTERPKLTGEKEGWERLI